MLINDKTFYHMLEVISSSSLIEFITSSPINFSNYQSIKTISYELI